LYFKSNNKFKCKVILFSNDLYNQQYLLPTTSYKIIRFKMLLYLNFNINKKFPSSRDILCNKDDNRFIMYLIDDGYTMNVIFITK